MSSKMLVNEHDSNLSQEAFGTPALSYPISYNLARHFGSSRVSPVTKSVISYAASPKKHTTLSSPSDVSTDAPLSSCVSTAQKAQPPYELTFMRNNLPYKREKKSDAPEP